MALSEHSTITTLLSRPRYAGRRPAAPHVAATPGERSRPGGTVRARQRAALLALRQAAGPEAVRLPSGEVQRTLWQWGRAVAGWLGLL